MRFAVISRRSCVVALAGVFAAAPASRAAEPVFTEFAGGLSANGGPDGIALGTDGNLWIGETRAPGRIAKVTPAGTATEFTGGVTPGLSTGHMLAGAARGPDGNLWFSDFTYAGGVVKVTPGGDGTEFRAACGWAASRPRSPPARTATCGSPSTRARGGSRR